MTCQIGRSLFIQGRLNDPTKVKAALLLAILFYFVLSSTAFVNANPIRIKSGDWIKYESVNIGKTPFSSGILLSRV